MTDRLPRDAEPDEAGWFAPGGPGSCVSPDLLSAMRAGALPPEVARRIDAHLARCSTCAALLEALIEMDGGPTAEEERRISQAIANGRRVRIASFRPMWLAAAAALVGAVGLAFMFRGSDSALPRVLSPSHDRVLTTPAFALVLDKPEIDLPADALVLRGGRRGTYAEALGTALEPWRRDAFGQAAAQFQQVAARYPDRPHGFYYLGVSRLLAGRAGEAVAPLQRARQLAADDRTFQESVTWYLAVAFERSGQQASAVSALADLCAGGTTRREAACRGLARLRPAPGETGIRERGEPSVGGALIDRASRGTAASYVPVR